MVPSKQRILCILLGLSLFSDLSLAQKNKCYQKLTEKSGIIQTPNYPEPYDADTDCYWEFIRPEEGQCVVFTVEDFNIDTEEKALCPGDHFALESCGSWLDITPERYYCGDYSDVIEQQGNFELIQHYQVNATSLRVSFHSDSSGESRGFLMQYRILDAEGCGNYIGPRIGKYKGEDCVALFSEESGRFISPNYPNPYPSDAACVYGFLKSSPDVCGVFLRAAKFDLEEKDGGTCHDYFGIPGCRLKCGTVKSPTLMFYEFQKGATLLPIQFKSDFSIEGRGFSFTYLQVTDCFNPYQAECPNDQLSLLAEPSECGYAEVHECSHNNECDGEQICCFDGCLRKCVNPVSNNVRRKREVMALEELLIHVNISEFGMHYNTPPNYKIKTQTGQINTPAPAIPWF